MDNTAINNMLVGVASALNATAAVGCGLIRCRISGGDVFCHQQRYFSALKPGRSKPEYIADCGGQYGHDALPRYGMDVFGWPLEAYVLQAFKGIGRGTQGKGYVFTEASQAIKPQMIRASQMMDEQALDRLYFARFDDQPMIGEGYAYCLKKLIGQPCQKRESFTGSVVYQAGIITLACAQSAMQVCEGGWAKSHLASLDGALRAVGLNPDIGYTGGTRPSKSQLRKDLQVLLEGITSLYHC